MNERDLERSEARVAAERDSFIRKNVKRVHAIGTDDCIDCSDPISEKRKQAAPFAKRCIACQTATETEGKRYA